MNLEEIEKLYEKCDQADDVSIDEINTMVNVIPWLISEVKRLREENKELNHTFDMIHKADVRGVQLYLEYHPDYPKLNMPDHGKLICWLVEENERLKKDYEELLYAVATKFPNKTRHETALMYIQDRENRTNGPTQQEVLKDERGYRTISEVHS